MLFSHFVCFCQRPVHFVHLFVEKLFLLSFLLLKVRKKVFNLHLTNIVVNYFTLLFVDDSLLAILGVILAYVCYSQNVVIELFTLFVFHDSD